MLHHSPDFWLTPLARKLLNLDRKTPAELSVSRGGLLLAGEACYSDRSVLSTYLNVMPSTCATEKGAGLASTSLVGLGALGCDTKRV